MAYVSMSKPPFEVVIEIFSPPSFELCIPVQIEWYSYRISPIFRHSPRYPRTVYN